MGSPFLPQMLEVAVTKLQFKLSAAFCQRKIMSENEENIESPEAEGEGNIDQEVIRAIPISMTVEVGSTSLKLRDLLRLSQGSVLELDRSVGELMDVKINNTVIAKGEVVTVGDKLGISVVEIVAPLERVKPV
jgi:flagellar motor switch protein FliN/FliY